MRRMMEDLDRMFDGFGSTTGRAGIGGSDPQPWGARGTAWAPSVDVYERDGKFVVRADLPGLSREDVKIEVVEDQLVIQGERHQEREIEKSGMYRAERVYGTFQRAIPLPEHADLDSAEAHFANGVLEMSFRLSEEKRQGRRIEITEGKQPSMH
jgi:HSP20 family protein